MLCLDTATAARAMAALVGDPPSDTVEPLALNATLAIAITYNAPWAHGQAIFCSDKIVNDSFQDSAVVYLRSQKLHQVVCDSSSLQHICQVRTGLPINSVQDRDCFTTHHDTLSMTCSYIHV